LRTSAALTPFFRSFAVLGLVSHKSRRQINAPVFFNDLEIVLFLDFGHRLEKLIQKRVPVVINHVGAHQHGLVFPSHRRTRGKTHTSGHRMAARIIIFNPIYTFRGSQKWRSQLFFS